MSESNGHRATGYESIADLGDTVRELIPARTEVTLHVLGFTLDTTKGLDKACVIGKFEVDGPEEFADYGSFTRRYYLGNTPKPGNKPDQTAFHMSRREWAKIIAAVLNAPIKDQDVANFFADGNYGGEPIEVFEHITAKLNTLNGQSFRTKIGVEIDRSGAFDPKQTVGAPIYPSEAEAAQARA